jgi:hypothetical protein
MESMSIMSSVGTVRLPFRKSNFCGEGQPDNHGAPLDASRGARRQWAARRGRRDRNTVQPHENLGRASVVWLSAAAAIGAAGSSIRFCLGSSIPPRSVDTPELFTYRGARPSCIEGMEAVVPRRRVGRQRTYENALLRIQPSVVNLGGTAVV